MNMHYRLLSVIGLLLICGCGAPPPPAPVGPPTALTLQEWQAITDIDLKYEGATLERLRLSDPSLQNNRNWQIFENQHVIPQRKKDIPYLPGQQPP
jgi:hypothetical protein